MKKETIEKLNKLFTERKENKSNSCSFHGCNQKRELASGSKVVAIYKKDSKGKELDYVSHSYETVQKNTFCRYHNWFINENTN